MKESDKVLTVGIDHAKHSVDCFQGDDAGMSCVVTLCEQKYSVESRYCEENAGVRASPSSSRSLQSYRQMGGSQEHQQELEANNLHHSHSKYTCDKDSLICRLMDCLRRSA